MAEAASRVNLTESARRETLRAMGGPWNDATLTRAGQNALSHGVFGDALKYLVSHTGLPILIVAGALIVLSLRLVRRAAAVFVEVGLAVAALAAATRFGWISW